MTLHIITVVASLALGYWAGHRRGRGGTMGEIAQAVDSVKAFSGPMTIVRWELRHDIRNDSGLTIEMGRERMKGGES